VKKIALLCNPAQKNTEPPPAHPTVHEVGYRIAPAKTPPQPPFVKERSHRHRPIRHPSAHTRQAELQQHRRGGVRAVKIAQEEDERARPVERP